MKVVFVSRSLVNISCSVYEIEWICVIMLMNI